MQFRRFQNRILFYFLSFFSAILVVVFLVVNAVILKNAREQLNNTLAVSSKVFDQMISARERLLVQATRSLSHDHSFIKAFAKNNSATTLSAVRNLRDRIRADAMILVSLEGTVMADSGGKGKPGQPVAFPDLIELADEEDEASGVVIVEGTAYHMVVVPLLMPLPEAWICAGFMIGDELAHKIEKVTLSHISIVQKHRDDSFSRLASSLSSNQLETVMRKLSSAQIRPEDTGSILMGDGDQFITIIKELPGGPVSVVLQRSLRQALKPFRPLRVTLFIMFLVALSGTIVLGMVIARSVSGPVRTLAAGVQNIERGDYGHRVNVLQQDEFGDLGRAFNSMAVGLEERDRVRSLLGKVVSPEIAEELLTRGVALGGEDREVTILFSDVRNFTTMSEKQTPQAVLNLLNTYLEGMSAVIDRHDGVVDKYIGDAIMALFGAPLQHEDDADRALSCAVEMIEALAAVNVKLKEDGFPRLDIGIGINTAVVVAGNMGSSNRLNYTVIGDGVNLAARLESACKQYGAHILVSEFTMAKLRGTYCNREVDKVVVKGKTEPLGIFEILGYHTEETFPNLVEALNHFNGGLELYREAKWDAAMDSFRNVLDLNPKDRLSETYIERCRYLKANPPEDEWDGIWVMTSK